MLIAYIGACSRACWGMAHSGAWIIWRGIETRNLSLYRVHVGRCVCYGWRVCVSEGGGCRTKEGLIPPQATLRVVS